MPQKLSKAQEEILNAEGNIIVSANAGSGKTFVLVEKINQFLDKNKTHKTIGAITFTRKAANEIKNRLSKKSLNTYVGTNDSFVLEEIILPFFKDVYKIETNIKFEPDYNKKVNDYNNAINIMLVEQVIPVFYDNKRNFTFQLAKYILENSKIARCYMKSKYSVIFIDEYQDCDVDMHDLFMYICFDLKIKLFVVGDDKQSIYIWRGANPTSFRKLCYNEQFLHKKLEENFRSCQQIKNYSYLFSNNNELFEKVENNGEVIGVYTNDYENCIPEIIKNIDRDKKCAILTYTKNMARSMADEFTKNDLNFNYIIKPTIEDFSSNDRWLYLAIAKFLMKQDYNQYSFLEEIPFEISNTIRQRLIIKITNLKLLETDKLEFKATIELLFQLLDYKLNNEKFKQLYLTITKPIYFNWFNMDTLKNVSMTLHISKGLEFDQVILLTSDFSLIEEENINLHYVGITRAKSKMFLLFDKENINCKRYMEQLMLKVNQFPRDSNLIININKL